MSARATEAATLAEVGAVLRELPLPPVEVRLPAELARRAVAAWARDDTTAPEAAETEADRRTRHHAGTLALIGLAVRAHGRREGEDVVVPLPVELAGVAMDAADG
ncbi:hypothetical protein [Amycolatopsis australiensis]|nr:hypothetical protein [Amycolatopsis australiensis]